MNILKKLNPFRKNGNTKQPLIGKPTNVLSIDLENKTDKPQWTELFKYDSEINPNVDMRISGHVNAFNIQNPKLDNKDIFRRLILLKDTGGESFNFNYLKLTTENFFQLLNPIVFTKRETEGVVYEISKIPINFLDIYQPFSYNDKTINVGIKSDNPFFIIGNDNSIRIKLEPKTKLKIVLYEGIPRKIGHRQEVRVGKFDTSYFEDFDHISSSYGIKIKNNTDKEHSVPLLDEQWYEKNKTKNDIVLEIIYENVSYMEFLRQIYSKPEFDIEETVFVSNSINSGCTLDIGTIIDGKTKSETVCVFPDPYQTIPFVIRHNKKINLYMGNPIKANIPPNSEFYLLFNSMTKEKRQCQNSVQVN